MNRPATLRTAAARRQTGALAAAVCLLASRGPASAEPASGPAPPQYERRQVCVRGACFDAEVAVTAEERARGLMYRKSLDDDRGMLFVFPDEGTHAFWMKNTLIELDIIFIGDDRRVVSVAARARPCRADPCEHYAPTGPVAYALEIAGGLATKHGIAAGDPVTFGEAISPRPPASGTR